MFDLHCHSEYSIDSQEPMEETTKMAINRNLKTICFTDHVDLFPKGSMHDVAFVKSHYFKSLNKVKYTYKAYIEVLSGVEIGMIPGLSARYNDFLGSSPFDYVILSLHTVQNRDLMTDWALTELPEIAIDNYYKEMIACLKEYDNYDALGHLDYLDRYFPDKDLIPPFSFYESQLREVFQILIDKGKALELNTGGMRAGLKYYHPKMEALSLYHNMGGEIITLGSDAHRKEDIGDGIKEAMRILREMGFRNTYKFVGRKRYALPLG